MMLSRVLTFAGKARHRGWDYVRAVSAYHAGRTRYRLRSNLPPQRPTDDREPSSFHFCADELRNICANLPQLTREQTVLEARKILEQRFEFRGLPEVQLGSPMDWNFMPEGNVSWFWDLNRHGYFVTLGLAYYITGDDAFHFKLTALWDDWIARNPAGHGSNSKWPFEVAARLGNWIWAYFLLNAETGGTDLRKYITSMREHAVFLAHHLEYHWPNNHLLLESKALYEFSLLFPQYNPGGELAECSGRVLRQQILTQALPDGVHAELCSMYHEIVASELLELMCLCRRLHQPLPALIESRILQMRYFSQALRRSDGSIPLLGDSSAEDSCLRFRGAGGEISAMGHCIGIGGDDTAKPEAARPPLELFPDAGYVVLRDDDVDLHVVFDAGPFSCCTTPNHAHCDALSLELFWQRPILVDSGFLHKWNDPKWDRYSRSTAAHNTVQIDGREQSDLSDVWKVAAAAKTRLLRHSTNGNQLLVCAETTPFWGARLNLRHQRELFWDGAALTVRDRFLGEGRHRLKWFFHLAPDLYVEYETSGAWWVTWDTGTVVCFVGTKLDLDIRVLRSESNPLQGWVARSSAVAVPASVVLITATVDFPQEIEFRFQLHERRA